MRSSMRTGTPHYVNLHTIIACCGLVTLLAGCGPTWPGEVGEGFGETGDPGGPTAPRPCERLEVDEIKCDVQGCSGRWSGTDLWSPALAGAVVDTFELFDSAAVWPCEHEPDVDTCVEIDGSGHVACLRFYDGWGVAVAPACTGFDWLDVGCGMISSAS